MAESDEGALEELGLTKNEALVYKTLLRLKSALAGEITAKSGIHRRNVYDALERLEEKGLASFVVKNNRRYFQPVPPGRLLELLKEKEDKVRNAMAGLEELFGKNAEREAIMVYTGVQGYKTMLEDILATMPPGSVWFSVPSSKIVRLMPAFMDFLHKRRVKKKIFIKAIFNEDEPGLERAKAVGSQRLSAVKTMPLEKQMPAGMNIYGKKCAITLVRENDEPIIVIFNNEFIAQAFMNFFNLLWKEAKPWKKPRPGSPSCSQPVRKS